MITSTFKLIHPLYFLCFTFCLQRKVYNNWRGYHTNGSPFLKCVVSVWALPVPFYPLPVYICGPFKTFWVISDKTQFLGSFQTKFNSCCVFEAKKSTFVWKGSKWPQMAKNIFGTIGVPFSSRRTFPFPFHFHSRGPCLGRRVCTIEIKGADEVSRRNVKIESNLFCYKCLEKAKA